MVSNRNRYVSESTSDDETGDMENLPNNQTNKPTRRPTRTPKCFTKNALMARENRLKKKMYISTLESQVTALKNENKKLNQMVDNHTNTISDLRKEVKYLKSILANSEGIGKLIKAISLNTGMPVTSSLKSAPKYQIPEKCVPEIKKEKVVTTSQNFDVTRHPWEETEVHSPYLDIPTPESTSSYYGSPEFEELNNEGLLLDMDLPIDMDNDELLEMIDEKALEAPILPLEYQQPPQEVKNAASKCKDPSSEEVGVCLHVSNNKVSLEFCPSCSDNALKNWKCK